MNMPIDPCTLLKFIRTQRVKAVARREHVEVMRLDGEERKHLEKCVLCAASIKPLYFQLWDNAQIGVDVYVNANTTNN